MSPRPDIRVRCLAVPVHLRTKGIRCFAQVVLDDNLFVDGITVRVSRNGPALVTWPERKDGRGQHHAIVRIFDVEIREAVERAVLAEAVRGGWLEPCRVQADSSAASKQVAR